MRFIYVSYNSDHYATSLRRDSQTRNLMWEHTAGEDSLLVQTRFGTNATELVDKGLMEALSTTELLPGRYTEVQQGVFARIVAAPELGRGGCPLNGEACSYTVFALTRQGDTFSVYEPRTQGIIRPWCDVPIELRAQTNKVTRTEGLFRKKEVDTGFFHIHFIGSVGRTYTNGDVYYRVGDVEIPLTAIAIEQKDLFVQSNKCPVVYSRNAGICVVAK